MTELATDGIPVAVRCRVLKLSRQPYSVGGVSLAALRRGLTAVLRADIDEPRTGTFAGARSWSTPASLRAGEFLKKLDYVTVGVAGCPSHPDFARAVRRDEGIEAAAPFFSRSDFRRLLSGCTGGELRM